MATAKELAVREIFARGMERQTTAKGPRVSMFCEGGDQAMPNGRSAVYGLYSPPKSPWEKQGKCA